LKQKNKFREWLADVVLVFYFWLAEMTEQEYWDRANSFRPTQDAQGVACALCGGELFTSYYDEQTDEEE